MSHPSSERTKVAPTSTTSTTTNDDFPLIHLPDTTNLHDDSSFEPPYDISQSLVNALKNSGFLLLTTPLIPTDMQRKVLNAATTFLDESKSPLVVSHPSDPKSYAMLNSTDVAKLDDESTSQILAEYYTALERTKRILLRCLAAGLSLDLSYFVDLHADNNTTLRLIRYHPLPPPSRAGIIRCKEHSDYGTLTLLLTDGTSGLEAFREGAWRPVPHRNGALVVNVGSLLSEWTGEALKATLHRVAAPEGAGGVARTSVAFFVDPNEGVVMTLTKKSDGGGGDGGEGRKEVMSVAEYIRWRSGGDGEDRDGVSFTDYERERLGRKK